MSSSRDGEHRIRIATAAFDLIEQEVRPFIAAGGRLWSKGSNGYPRRLRQVLQGLDAANDVTFGTPDAMLLERRQRVVEHVVPMKRIIVEIVDPAQADPRSNTPAAHHRRRPSYLRRTPDNDCRPALAEVLGYARRT